jgi:hypothetical protein
VLQLEGAKHWDLFPATSDPGSLSHALALHASGTTIAPEDVEAAEAQRVRVTLREGETSFLYVPRGSVHVCTAPNDDNRHSVHVTISATQTNTWLELFQRFLPLALHRLAVNPDAPSLLRQVDLVPSLAATTKPLLRCHHSRYARFPLQALPPGWTRLFTTSTTSPTVPTSANVALESLLATFRGGLQWLGSE